MQRSEIPKLADETLVRLKTRDMSLDEGLTVIFDMLKALAEHETGHKVYKDPLVGQANEGRLDT